MPSARRFGVAITTAVLSVALVAAISPSAAAAPRDPLVDQQYYLTLISAPSAWKTTTGAGQVVAVIDSGVDGGHPDLVGQVISGYDAASRRPIPAGYRLDMTGHGTAVAGIIAGAVNGVGITGVSPDVKIMPVRVFGASGITTSDLVADGVRWATANGATVINLSLVLPAGDDANLKAAIQEAVDSGISVIAAVGNERERGNPAVPPATYPGVIGVASVGPDERVSPFSEFGSQVDIAAPGDQLLTALSGGGYALYTGTSLATPVVSATVALLRSLPGATAELVEKTLLTSAVDAGAAGWDPDYGYGIVNPKRAIAAALKTWAGATPEVDTVPADPAPQVPDGDGVPAPAPSGDGVPALAPGQAVAILDLGQAPAGAGSDGQSLTVRVVSTDGQFVGQDVLVKLQQKVKGKWRTIGRTRANADGLATFTVRTVKRAKLRGQTLANPSWPAMSTRAIVLLP